MTDRELLEFAAKAADDGIVFYGECWRAQTGREWNPLTDDGDALRLAVKLGISLDRASNRCWAWVSGWAFNGVCEEFYCTDPYAATRRAIVRAAAEIGKEMT
jgi:hypothetical protein